jgi:hypothetical protein
LSSISKACFKGLFTRNKVFSAGIIVLATAVVLISSAKGTLEVMSECNFPGGVFPPGQGRFFPGSSYSITCDYKQDIGQDLIFWASIFQEPEPIAIPSHVVIRDPNNDVIVSENFHSSTIVVYIRPEIHGIYTATIISSEDPSSQPQTGDPIFVRYALGHLTSTFPGVKNPLGDAISSMVYWGYVLILPGLILIGIAVAKMFYKSSKSSDKKS